MSLRRKLLRAYYDSGLADYPKRRRYAIVMKALNLPPGASVLEVGCAFGGDFLQFAIKDGYDCTGLDNVVWPHKLPFKFIEGDAKAMPFGDQQFDACVSIGMLEHVKPTELAGIAAEMRRVGKKGLHIVPSLATPLEPHNWRPIWGLRGYKRKRVYPNLYYYSDEVWLDLFPGSTLQRFWYLPMVTNVLLYY